MMRINGDYTSSSITYTNKGLQSVSSDTARTFSDIVEQKASDADKKYCMERAAEAFDTIGAYSPNEVKQAWIEASEETGSNGFSITSDGKHFHIPKLLVQHAIRWYNGEVDPDNILGNSIESAISVAEKALYDIDHPLPGSPAKSLEVQQEIKKERAFYVAFLEKLKKLYD